MSQDQHVVSEYLAAKQAYVDATNHDLTDSDPEIHADQDRYLVALEAYIADFHAIGEPLPEGVEYELTSLRNEVAKRPV